MPITYSNNQVFLNGLEVSDFEVDGIDTRDFPDFCDAYIESASVLENDEWREATDDELDELNNDSDLVYEQVENFLY
jgi:hypothetical protein